MGLGMGEGESQGGGAFNLLMKPATKSFFVWFEAFRVAFFFLSSSSCSHNLEGGAAR